MFLTNLWRKWTASRGASVEGFGVTRILKDYQVAIPEAIQKLFDLKEGDCFEWGFDKDTSRLQIVPKRAQLITPEVIAAISKSRQEYRTNTHPPQP
jgi:bifunctional DNA-binding transcriptional regulator/antitoxin component of YhaV-PrlF toxin-antitoxin module